MASSNNRVKRVTFMVSSVKTSSHLADVAGASGSKNRYDEVRNDTIEPQNRHFVPQNRYVTEES